MTSYHLNYKYKLGTKFNNGHPSYSYCKTITELNNDCLNHVIGFLKTNDLLNLGLIDERFASLAADHLHMELFDVHKFMENFCLDKAKCVLKKFGHCIRKVILTAQLCSIFTDKSKPYISLLIEYCQNIKEIHISHINIKYIDEDIFRYCRNTLEVLNTTRFLNSNQEKCIISELTKLQRLNLCLSDITGKELQTLTNLSHLELAGCKYLESENFERVCKNNQLKLLDIRYCSKLDSKSFETIVSTQSTNLEELAISSTYPLADVCILTKLKNLKRIRISFYGSMQNNSTLRHVVENLKDSIECLKIDRTCSRVDDESELRYIWRLTNLTQLKLCGFDVTKKYLLALLECCKNLHSLFVVPALSNDLVIETQKRNRKLKFYG